MNWPITAFHILIGLTVLFISAHAGEVYRWTDADGNVNISELKYVEEDIVEAEARLKAIELHVHQPSGDQGLSP